MTEGTSQGLFIVVAIVIFGIFVVLANTLFGSEGLSNDLKGLFENATEQASDNLLVGKNLIEEYNMTVTTANISVLDRVTDDISFSSNGASLGGVNVNSNSLKPNKWYSLNFKLTKLDGEINRVGGHIGISTKFKVYINDELQERKLPEDITANDFSYGFPYNMSDGEIIDVRVEFLTNNYFNETYPDRPLKIQPNRMYKGSYDTGFGKVYTAKVTNINLEILN